MRIFGYIRVSSGDQNDARQKRAMEALEIPADRIFIDVKSGKDFERPSYKAMLRELRAGDLLCVSSLDRLGRNYEEILCQWRLLTREMRVDIRVLDMPLLDTGRDKNLLGAFISDLVLQILSFVAQTERENIRKRQAEGIAAAKSRGVRFGPKPRPLPDNFEEIVSLSRQGLISRSQAAKLVGMSRSMFYAKIRKDRPVAEN